MKDRERHQTHSFPARGDAQGRASPAPRGSAFGARGDAQGRGRFRPSWPARHWCILHVASPAPRGSAFGARGDAQGRASPAPRGSAFGARGGWWVVAQVPVLFGALLIPLASGAGALGFTGPAQWLGFALTAAGGVVTLLGLVTLGDALSPFPRPRDGSTLKQHGIYKLVRHPVYSGVIIGSIGWALWWGSVAGVAYGVVVIAFFDRKAAREEAWLREHHAGYEAYARRVKKFLPGIY